jgi:hypothetical protein
MKYECRSGFFFCFNHGTISIFEIRERKDRMSVWNQVDAAPSSRKFVSITNFHPKSAICS